MPPKIHGLRGIGSVRVMKGVKQRLYEHLWPDFTFIDWAVEPGKGLPMTTLTAQQKVDSHQPTYQDVSDALDHPDRDVREWVARNWVAEMPEPAESA